MKINKAATILFATIPLIMSACASERPRGGMTFQYNTVAGFDDYAGVFEGTVSVAVGGRGEIILREIGGNITCDGWTQMTERPGRRKLGSSGVAEIECSDGRTATATWFQSLKDGGEGVGKDQNGNQFRLRYDLDPAILEDYKQTLLAASAKGGVFKLVENRRIGVSS